MHNIIEKFQFENYNEYVVPYNQSICGKKKQSNHLNELVKLYTQGDNSLIDKKKRKSVIKGNVHTPKVKINNYLIKKINDTEIKNKKNSYINTNSSNSRLNISSTKNSYLGFDSEREKNVQNSTVNNKNVKVTNYDSYPERKIHLTTSIRNVMPNKKNKVKLLKKMFIDSNDSNNLLKDEVEGKIKKIVLPEVHSFVGEKRKMSKDNIKPSKNNSIIEKTKLQVKERNNNSSSILKRKAKIMLHKEINQFNKEEKEKIKKVTFHEHSYIKKPKLNISILKPNETQNTSNHLTEITTKNSQNQNNNISSNIDNNNNTPQINNSNITIANNQNNLQSSNSNISNKNETNNSLKSKDIATEIRKPQFRIINVHQVKPITNENSSTSLPTHQNLPNTSNSNQKELSYNSEDSNNSNNNNYFILKKRTHIQLTNLRLNNKSTTSLNEFHTQTKSLNNNQNKRVSNNKNSNDFFLARSNTNTSSSNNFLFKKQKSEIPHYLSKSSRANLKAKLSQRNSLLVKEKKSSSFLNKMRVRKIKQPIASSLFAINDKSFSEYSSSSSSSSSEITSNSSISQSEGVRLTKNLFECIFNAENAENKFNGINCTNEDIDFNSKEYKYKKEYVITKEEKEMQLQLNQVKSNNSSFKKTFFNKVLTELKHKNVFHAVAKKLKKELGNFITECITFDIEKDENFIYMNEYFVEECLNKETANNHLCIASNKYLEINYFEFNVGMQFQYLQQDEEDNTNINENNNSNDILLQHTKSSHKKHKHKKNIFQQRIASDKSMKNLIEKKRYLQLYMFLDKAYMKNNNVLFIDELILNDLLFWQECNHHHKIKPPIKNNYNSNNNINTIKNKTNQLHDKKFLSPVKNKPSLFNINQGEVFQRKRKRGKTRQINVNEIFQNLLLHSKSIVMNVNNSFNRRKSTQLSFDLKFNEHSNTTNTTNHKSHIFKDNADVNNDKHINSKKNKNNSSRKPNIDVKEYSIIKKINYTRESIKIYESKRKHSYNTNHNYNSMNTQKPFFSSENKDVTLLQTYLIKDRYVKSIKNDIHKLILFYIKENNLNLVKQIVEANYAFLKINYKDSFGNTLLCHAVRYASLELIEFLLMKGANPNICNVSIYYLYLFIIIEN